MSNISSKNIEKFAKMFKALSNPNRLKIFTRLASCCVPGATKSIKESPDEEDCVCIGELGKDLNIVASTVSHHIKELHRTGLIQIQRRGQKIDCWVEPETISALNDFFSQ